jgi:hypothetical protein
MSITQAEILSGQVNGLQQDSKQLVKYLNYLAKHVAALSFDEFRESEIKKDNLDTYGKENPDINDLYRYAFRERFKNEELEEE